MCATTISGKDKTVLEMFTFAAPFLEPVFIGTAIARRYKTFWVAINQLPNVIAPSIPLVLNAFGCLVSVRSEQSDP